MERGSAAVPDELGPGVCEHKVLDALLGVVEDGPAEGLRDGSPVLHHVLDISDLGVHGFLRGLGQSWGRQIEGELVEGADGV